jgi:hypothetical protein
LPVTSALTSLRPVRQQIRNGDLLEEATAERGDGDRYMSYAPSRAVLKLKPNVSYQH